MSFLEWFFNFWWLFGTGKKPEKWQTQTRLRRWLGIMPKRTSNGIDGMTVFDDSVIADYRFRGCEAEGHDKSGQYYSFYDTCRPGSCFVCDCKRQAWEEAQQRSNLQKKSSSFDPDFSPSNPVNVHAAKEHGLRYDPEGKVYRDEDGCPVRDQFGQRL